MQKIILKPIKHKKAFSEAYKSGKKFFHESVYISICFEKVSNKDKSISIDVMVEQKEVYFAVLISKKVAKKAIVRNRIKRLLRESIRKYFIDLHRRKSPCIFKSLIISWKTAPKHFQQIHLSDVYPVINSALQNAYNYYTSNIGVN